MPSPPDTCDNFLYDAYGVEEQDDFVEPPPADQIRGAINSPWTTQLRAQELLWLNVGLHCAGKSPCSMSKNSMRPGKCRVEEQFFR
jgi:hypothetical protein